VTFPLAVPEELVFILEVYRKHMKITSRNQAIRTLIETHPDIAFVVSGVYDKASGAPSAHGERVASI
jgi:hypothetical protein